MGCAAILALALGMGANMNEQIVLGSFKVFSERQLEVLFSDYYHAQMDTVRVDSNSSEVSTLRGLSDEQIKADPKLVIDALTTAPGERPFENMDVLREHVRKQFEEEEVLDLDVQLTTSQGDFVVTRAVKHRDTHVFNILTVYEIQDHKIRRMWMALLN